MAELPLAAEGVEVWFAPIDNLVNDLRAHAKTLSQEERVRARRFHFQRDRQIFIAARGTLRILLGHYVGISPSEVRIHVGPHGKPSLSNGAFLRFNLSHCQGMVCYAFSRQEVGIDVELVQPDVVRSGLVSTAFAPGEVAAWRALPAELRVEGFYACWTRKEAYMKGRGLGMALPLDRFEVTVEPDRNPAILRVDASVDDGNSWSLIDLAAPAGYRAALAVAGPLPSLIRREIADVLSG